MIKRVIGICLMLLGLSMGAYHFIVWQIGHSAAENLTMAEVQHYKREVLSTQKGKDDWKPFLIKPSTEVDHTIGDEVASLVIPSVEMKYSVYWGTDSNVLKNGVGMYVSPRTTAPDGGGHTVMSGHRDTVFYRLKYLKEGDSLQVEYRDSIYTYQVEKIWITDAEDRSVIVDKEKPTLTLTTCYPFQYFGNAPQRYIVQAELQGKRDV
ncbi:class D sortase [Mesobacillus maritimus]|uniref:class D sortase n=1 Tax=Mesobacillus maritimus TaxID=1643336 RepID=UPI00203E8CAC|nr:class D sortase [Mesobacillus maritimus]MCM3670692.1 class D sortase [Mesobacillus maritimus]